MLKRRFRSVSVVCASKLRCDRLYSSRTIDSTKLFSQKVLQLDLHLYKMATSAQSRLDRLLKSMPKPQVEDNTDKEIFWKKELVEAQQRRQPKPPRETNTAGSRVSSVDNNNDDQMVSSTKIDMSSKNQDDLIYSTAPTEGHVPSATPAQVVYLPTGKSEWASAANEIVNCEADDYVDMEPVSSSAELIGRFCIFSQVAKFPYKYMSDPESTVSRRFFAAEKAYERNWSM